MCLKLVLLQVAGKIAKLRLDFWDAGSQALQQYRLTLTYRLTPVLNGAIVEP